MQIVFLEKKNIADTTNIDQWSPTFTFFNWSRVQKDALFKALNSETVYRDPTNYTLLGSQKHITLNMRLGPIRECPPPQLPGTHKGILSNLHPQHVRKELDLSKG